MRIIPTLLTKTITITLLIGFSGNLYAEKRQTIRFYKLNTKDQPVRVSVREKTAKKPGCHNFTIKKKIFRLTQIGFEYCTVFSQKSCASGSEISGKWDGNLNEIKLTQGGEWLFLDSENPRGVKIKSWYCQ